MLVDGDTVALVAALLGAVAVLCVGVGTWIYQTRISARRATLDFISTTEVNSTDWLRMRRTFRLAVKENFLLELVDPDSSRLEAATDVLAMLNHFELVAVGIENGGLDKKMYAAWYQTGYVKTWNQASSFVDKLRTNRNQTTLFSNFRSLAEEWEETVRKRTPVR